MIHRGQRSTVQRGVQELRHIRWRAGHVYLYPIQPLVPQFLAPSENIFKRGGADFGFRVAARLLLRNEGNADADGHLGWLTRKREESPRFDHATDEVNREVEPRFAETSRDDAVSVCDKFGPPVRRMEEGILYTYGSPVQTPN